MVTMAEMRKAQVNRLQLEREAFEAEIARLRADYQETIEKLQAVCEEFGCSPGLNRFDFLRTKIAKLQAEKQECLLANNAKEMHIQKLFADRARLRAAINRALQSNPYNQKQIETAMDDLRTVLAEPEE